MAEVIEALESARVVTLTGVGGVGKTRLAIQVAAELLPHFRDGAWLVELGPLERRRRDYPMSSPRRSGGPASPGMTMTESVVDALREKQSLVVLDNCEHVIAAAARMVDEIVRSCPGIRVLSTSREGLGLRGERQTHGALTRRRPPSRCSSSSDRAQEADGRFELDENTEPVVEQICTRLDGIPLALELAAARTRMMTPTEIAARLDERFRLLTGGSRTAVERHQTLRQAVDWSYDLLGPREREILNRLGVFAGGFTLDAAEAVVSGGDVDEADVLDGVAQLVDKSLVVADREGDETRYRLLETIRQYALERLDEAGLSDTVRRLHAEWCAEFIARASIGVHGREEVHWLARLNPEIENLRAGVTWAAEIDDADLALRQIGHFTPVQLMFRTAGYRLGPLADVALSTTGALDHPLAAVALASRAIDHLHHDRVDDAERDAREGIRLEQGSGAVLESFYVLVMTRVYAGTMRWSSDERDAAIEAARTIDDPFLQCMANSSIAGWFFAVNASEEGLPFAEEAMRLATELGNPSTSSMARYHLGGALMERDPQRARQLLLEGIDLGHEVGNDFFMGMTLGRLARMGADASDPVWARQFRDAINLAVEHGDRRNLYMLLDVQSQALTIIGRGQPAARLLGYVQENSRHMQTPYSESRAAHEIADLAASLGEQRLEALRAEGAAMDFAEAVELSRAELDRVIEGVPSGS